MSIKGNEYYIGDAEDNKNNIFKLFMNKNIFNRFEFLVKNNIENIECK
jgi:hypothetical protein